MNRPFFMLLTLLIGVNVSSYTQCVGFTEELSIVFNNYQNNYVEIAWEITGNKQVAYYIVERETTNNGVFEVVDTVVMYNSGWLIDRSESSFNNATTYRLVTVDSCGNKTYSATHTTMHEFSSSQTNNGIYLSWDSYNGINTNASYKIFSISDNSFEPKPIDQVPLSTNNYLVSNDSLTETGVSFMVCLETDEIINVSHLKTDVGLFYLSCTMESPKYYADPTALYENESKRIIELSPNPADDFITISVPDNFEKFAIVEIINSNGNIVCRDVVSFSGKIPELEISYLSAGFYTLQIRTETSVCKKPFIKK